MEKAIEQISPQIEVQKAKEAPPRRWSKEMVILLTFPESKPSLAK